MKILVINGPNLNLLGTRKPEIYGTETLEDMMDWVQNSQEAKHHTFKFFQSNHEGKIIDVLQKNRQWANGIIINPGAFTHYSYAIRDAIEAINIPTVEVHLSDIHQREEFRRISVISPVCLAQVSGLGKEGYLESLRILLS